MRVLLFFIGAAFGSFAVLIGWVVSFDCPPNRLVISASLPPHLSAEVIIGDRRIWSGTRNSTEEIAFLLGKGDQQFLVRISNGTETTVGYVEKADGLDHILFLNEDNVSYGFLDRGLPEFLRRHAACLGR